MKRIVYFRLAQLALLALMLSLSAGAVRAQTTSFTYQGSLNDGGSPANGAYDLQFKLFDALSGGAQQGLTILRDDVQVTNGAFTVTLDFGAPAFPGANRFLEIGVRPGVSTGAFTTLSPRQQIASTPYAIKSLGATSADSLSIACVNCVTSNQIGSLPTGNSNYIQNTTSQQSSANFNISGNGTAGGTLSGDIVNATTQYNIGGSRVLSTAGTSNLFAGVGAGQSITTGGSNAFFGLSAGFNNSTGGSNAFFGRNAGGGNTTGGNNAFFGWNAGATNTTGGNNTVIGAGANIASGALNFATAIGAGAVASASNTVALGRNLDTVSVPGNLTVTGTLAATLPSGSANYIQNTTSQQASANFNISGNGTAGGTLSGNVVNATTQYNIGGSRVLSAAGAFNLFAGAGAGAANTGNRNSFFGSNAGAANTTGNYNAFFGTDVGAANTTGCCHAFFGANAGVANTTGTNNSFFGAFAGQANTTGGGNSFFGISAGQDNTTGGANSIFGSFAGIANTTGSFNSFFGRGAGAANTSGGSNSFYGAFAGLANTTGSINSFFGLNAGRSNTTGASNSFFGHSAGLANMTANGNSFFGASAGAATTTGIENAFFGLGAGAANTIGFQNSFLGAFAGSNTTDGKENSFFGVSAGFGNTAGFDNSFFGLAAGLSNTTGNNNTVIGTRANVAAGDLSFATAIGANAVVSTSNTIVLGRSFGEDTVNVPGKLVLGALGVASATHLCRNASNEISTCSSSLRYKDQVLSFRSGLDLIGRLRPVTFNWKNTNERDLGLIAEEVAAIEPLLVTRNAQGEIEGVKYDQLNVVLINAVKQQQEQIKQQQAEIEQLKQLVCADRPQAAVCKPGKQTR